MTLIRDAILGRLDGLDLTSRKALGAERRLLWRSSACGQPQPPATPPGRARDALPDADPTGFGLRLAWPAPYSCEPIARNKYWNILLRSAPLVDR